MKRAHLNTNLAVVSLGGTPPVRGRHVVAVPGEAAPVYTLDLPHGVTGAARLRVAKQQLAGRLGLPPDAISLTPLGDVQNWTRAIVCDAQARRDWAQDAAARSTGCRAVLPDYLTLPACDGKAVLRQVGDRLLARIGLTDGFSAPLGIAPQILSLALQGTTIKVALVDGAMAPAVISALQDAGLTPDSDMTGAMNFAAGELAADLRRGQIADAGHVRTTLRIGMAAAALLGVAIGLWSASILIQTRTMLSEAERLRDVSSATLRNGLIPDGPILDVRQQVIRALETVGTQQKDIGQDLPLTLLSRATVVIFGKGAEMRSAAFAQDTGLQLTLVASDFAAVDALVTDMRDAGLAATTGALRARDTGGVEAEIIIAEAAE